jgi:hypothetical protein
VRFHVRNCRAAAVKDPLDVDVEDAVVEVVGRLLKRREPLRQAGVVEQHVKAAEAVDRGGDHALDLVGPCYVYCQGLGLATARADLLSSLLSGRRLNVGHDHGSAFVGERQR